ncbi:ABC transporter ATP-binding protein [uncultured Alsobacter sp.]|uniref:ABC transporter ATP-binding protein n=1 Tax=uncultured Alsobacter sp. TaxID=1748258 RepID=UPI0025F438E3|nr:ABC transporter ATP-binding protein [uncultured Alsobacter sp.]
MTNAVEIENLVVEFTGGSRPVRALDGISLSLKQGEVLALLGESGSGKSVTLRSLLRLHNPKRSRTSGKVTVSGRDVNALDADALADLRGGVVSMVFQEPMLALDPVYTVGEQIAEAVVRHEGVSKAEARARALALFERVRIPSPERRLDAYPHEMSGGMRQRAMIALALACKPSVLLADEPTTALDATVQIQILLLLRELQREFGLSIIFVTHDIGVAVEIADRVAVMYAGRIVETGPVAALLHDARHPYTRGLLASRVERVARGERLETIPGSPPDLAALPPGCAFGPRCSRATSACQTTPPELMVDGQGRAVACFNAMTPAE